MITIVLFSYKDEEIRSIRRVLSAYSIQHSWAECQVEVIRSSAELERVDAPVDILIPDVSDLAMVEAVKRHKAFYPPVRIFPIAGPDISPTAYVCPEIMPCGLFWRPVSQASVEPVVEQMMAMVHDQTVAPSQESFRISGKQKVQEIPYSTIVFFEAREKKIALRMREQELTFAATLSKLEEALPSEFIRCHKSFIVNRRHILSVDRTNASVILDNQMEIPISRSYKKLFWEAYHEDI